MSAQIEEAQVNIKEVIENKKNTGKVSFRSAHEAYQTVRTLIMLETEQALREYDESHQKK